MTSGALQSDNTTESTPLLDRESEDRLLFKTQELPTREMFWEELKTFPRYVWPILGAQWMEYSMVAANIIAVGHVSTTALAAVSLGTITANVTGFSVLYGMAGALDTVLPAAFTSPHPELVGLWSQRMGNSFKSYNLEPRKDQLQLFSCDNGMHSGVMSPQETHSNDASESTPLLNRENEDVALLKTDGIPTREMFWEELWTLPRYVWPVLGAQWLEYSMIAVNIISIGHLSTTALAAISLGTMTANVTGISVLYGLSSGLDTLLPAAFTSPHPQLVGLWSQRMGNSFPALYSLRKSLTASVAVIMACALVPICIVWYNAEAIFIALDQDPEVSRLSTAELAEAKDFSVWGPEPIRLGFIGAPVATITSYYLISIASFIYGRYFIPQTAWHPLSSKMFCDLGLLTGLGLSGRKLLRRGGRGSPTALACQSILLSTSSATFQIFFSSAQAATIRVGNLLGEKNAIRAHVASKAGLVGVFLATIVTRQDFRSYPFCLLIGNIHLQFDAVSCP
ncbi:hypothetical protein H0H93_006855 [Arthromyces matolae]|nr:hypothetical protein H0H93_006855 [Arthromyces matolae]